MDAQSLATLTPTVQYRSVHVDQNMAEAQEARFPSLAINNGDEPEQRLGGAVRGMEGGGSRWRGGRRGANHRGIYQVETVGE